MQTQRRDIIKLGAALSALAAAGVSLPQAAWAQTEWNKAAFDAKSLEDAFKALGAKDVSDSDAIVLVTPDIAENGAVVQVGALSKLPNTQSISILIEKNPSVLAASFLFPEGTEPGFTTRVKMGKTSKVLALVQADGKFYVVSREIKVTLGGCGG